MKTELKVDSMGRVVLPKPLRRLFGLTNGSVLKVKVTPEHIELTPQVRPPGLREENGLLMHEGRLEENKDWIEGMRDDRDQQNWGF